MAKATIISRTNPRTGEVERPWQDAFGNYVLADPKYGSARNRREHAVLTTDFDEAVALIRKGFSIRMAAKGAPASLIAPRSLTIEEIDADDPSAAVEIRPQAPFARALMLSEFRKALMSHAVSIACWGSREAAAAFIGFPPSDSLEPYEDADPEQIDLARFEATSIFEASYDFAFQVGQPDAFSDATWHELARLIDGAPNGPVPWTSPMAWPDSALRRTADTAFARWKLDHELWLPLTVRELALLARMDEAAVRNALGRDNISARGGVPNDTARNWLQQRRGFVPTISQS